MSILPFLVLFILLDEKYGNVPGGLKLLEGLKSHELREELEARVAAIKVLLKLRRQQVGREITGKLQGVPDDCGKEDGMVSRVRLACIAMHVQTKEAAKEYKSPLTVMLLETAVRMSEILCSQDSRRYPKTILQLHKCSCLHHELWCHFLHLN